MTAKSSKSAGEGGRMSKPGHNSGPISADRLKSFIERIEKLEEERKAIGGDIKDVYSEAKGVGYDVATMRKIVTIRAKDAADVAEQETLLDAYKHALGMPTGGHLYAPPEPSEAELEERAGRIAGEVDRCMALVTSGNLPKIEDIKRLIGCSNGKAQKLRGMIATRLEQFSRLSAETRENPQPEDGDDGITESCGERAGTRSPNQSGVETARYDGDARNQANPAVVGPPARFDSGPHDADAVCVHCAGKRVIWCHGGKSGETGEWVDGYENPCPFCADESPAPPSVGAVASESERVAPPYPDDDDLTIPSYLRGPSPANRRVA